MRNSKQQVECVFNLGNQSIQHEFKNDVKLFEGLDNKNATDSCFAIGLVFFLLLGKSVFYAVYAAIGCA